MIRNKIIQTKHPTNLHIVNIHFGFDSVLLSKCTSLTHQQNIIELNQIIQRNFTVRFSIINEQKLVMILMMANIQYHYNHNDHGSVMR